MSLSDTDNDANGNAANHQAGNAERDEKKESEKAYIEKELSPELWEIVIMKEPYGYSIFQQVCNACLYFRDKYITDQTYYLFHTLASILASRYHNNHTVDPDYNETTKGVVERTNCSLCLRNRRTRWFSGLLECRLVAHKWRDAIDNYHAQNHTFHFFPESANMVSTGLVTNSLGTSYKCSQFLRHFDPSHFDPSHEKIGISPFIGKCVHVDLGEEIRIQSRTSSNTTNCHSLFTILRQYGSFIDSFSFENSDRHENSTSTLFDYGELRDFISCMDFLVNLDVKLVFNEEIADVHLQKSVEEKPLPKREHLKVVRCSDFTLPFLKEFLKKNGHIKTLMLKDLHIRDDNKFFKCIYKLPVLDLDELSLHYSSPARFHKLGNYRVFCPFKKLSIHIGFPAKDDLQLVHSFTLVFMTIQNLKFVTNPADIQDHRLFNLELSFGSEGWFENNFNDVLRSRCDQKNPTNLETETPIVSRRRRSNEADLIPVEGCELLELRLPYLKFFKIRMGALMCLNFLMPARATLETLEIELQCAIDVHFFPRDKMKEFESKSEVKFFSNFRHPKRSNVWKLFPVLRLIKVSGSNGFHRTFLRGGKFYGNWTLRRD